MVANQVQKALVQVLECYRRCGVTHAARSPDSDVPSELFEAVDQLLQRQSGHTPTSAEPLVTSPNAPNVATGTPPGPSPVPATSVASAQTAEPPPLVPNGGENWALPVLEMAERESNLLGIDQEVKACRQCSNIVDFRQQTVFGTGDLDAKVCFMGEAPGADEDRQGVPFVGRAGQLLTKIIQAMKLSREEVFILNALKCRPPQNRTPVPEEIQACRGFVQRQLDVIQPEYIVCLGAVAVRSLLQSDKSIGRLRGEFYKYRGAKVVVTYHPSYLLRNENAKRFVWEDMKMLMRDMGTLE